MAVVSVVSVANVPVLLLYGMLTIVYDVYIITTICILPLYDVCITTI